MPSGLIVLEWRTMSRNVLSFLLLASVVLLCGCLFSVNVPIVAPDGTIAVFLEQHGGYKLFPEVGVLHLLRGSEWVSVPAAVLSGAGGLMDLSPDGSELLYIDIRSGEFLDPLESTVYRVALQPDAVPVVVLETEGVIAKASWTDDGRILLLEFGEEASASLELLDPVTGEKERLFDDLLSFEISQDRRTLTLIGVDSEVTIGRVERWDPASGRRTELATLCLGEASTESFAMLPHSFLWDVSPDGRWLAVALYDTTVLEPAVESDLPSLYLIDTEYDTAERIAVDAVMPSFSPEGDGLIYLRTSDGETGVVMWHELESGISTGVPGSEGVSTAFWLSPGRLGMTFEARDDFARLVQLDLASGEKRELVAVPHE